MKCLKNIRRLDIQEATVQSNEWKKRVQRLKTCEVLQGIF